MTADMADMMGLGSDLPVSGHGRGRLLARGLTGVLVAAMAAFLLLRMELYRLPLPESTRVALAATAFIVFGVAALIMCGLAARAAPAYERRAWVLLALGASLMVLGDSMSLYAGGSSGLGAPPTTLAPTAVWISSYVAFFAAAVSFVEPVPGGGLARFRRSLDAALVVLMAAAIVFAVALFPAYGMRPDRPLLPAVLSYASLVLAISLIVLVVTSRPRLRVWHVPLVIALAAVAAGSLVGLFAPEAGLGAHGEGLGQVVDLPWLVAYAMFTLAAFVRIRQRRIAPHLQELKLQTPPPWAAIALMAAIFLALPAFIYLGVAWEGDPLGFWLFTGLAALLGLVAIGRNLVLTLENTSLRERSLLDPLTDLFNHRYFHERLDAELRRADREASPLSIVCIDVDDFDKVNTGYGHAVGDQRLRSIADRLSEAARVTDVVCRVGGDEFAVIMPDTEPVEAYKACLRLQDAVGTDDDACPLPIGLSIGVAGTPEHGSEREKLVQRADGALYWAKFHGRAQVVIYDPTLVVALGPEQRIEMLEEESYVRMVQLLAAVVDARDPYTQQHSRSVAGLAVRFCDAMGVEPERIEAIETAALLHDVGKIGVPDGVLLKTGALSDEEYSQVKEHPGLAARILSAIPRQEVLPWIVAHHERWDGAGYPNGLKGEGIPFEARVLAICDAYDAMTSQRTYRTAIEPAGALDELIDKAGSQFDPHMTAIFVALMRDVIKREKPRAGEVLAAAG